jgi:hypothetical protein
MARKAQIFISYSQKDAEYARQIRAALSDAAFEPWLDVEQLEPGDYIARKLEQAISSSDYYVILISVLLGEASVPLELRGLLYIDFRASVSEGINKLKEFFAAQFTPVGMLDRSVIVRKNFDEREMLRRSCQDQLRRLKLGDLRHALTDRLSREHVEVVWFDIFERQLADEVQAPSVASCLMQLLDRARREGLISRLIDILCRNHPYLGRA